MLTIASLELGEVEVMISDQEGSASAEGMGVSEPAQVGSKASKRRGGRCSLAILRWGLPLIGVVLVLYALPNGGTPGSFTSGGLGLTRAEWNNLYTETGNPSGYMKFLSS